MDVYHPLNALKPFAPGIWIVDGGIIHMRYLGGQIPFTTRMVVIQRPDRTVWLWSPIEFDEELARSIDELGPVADIVSPNAIHYANIPAWARRYPEARLWASPGVRERSASEGFTIAFTHDLVKDHSPWSGDIEPLLFEGSRILPEFVFFHPASKTLILADLIENFERAKLSPPAAFIAWLAGTLHPDGKAPIDLRLAYVGRKSIARRSFATLMQWPIERVIMAHGKCYAENGREELRRAFRWLDR